MEREGKKYLPGELLAVPLDLIPREIPLTFPIFLKVAENFVLFRPLGDQLTENRIQKLLDHTVDTVFIPEEYWSTLLLLIEGQADGAPDPVDDRGLEKVRNAILIRTREVDRKVTVDSEYLNRLARLGEKLAHGVHFQPGLAAKIIRKFQDPSLYFTNHQINVAAYSLALANRIGVPLREAKQLAFAALAHNLGNIFIPKDILYKPGPLTKAEKDRIQEHPLAGAKLLKDHNAPKEVILCAQQHHECVDGTGYPGQLPGTLIHLFARIIAIADVYDALTNLAPYRSPRKPEEALEIMRSLKGKFDPNLVGKLALS